MTALRQWEVPWSLPREGTQPRAAVDAEITINRTELCMTALSCSEITSPPCPLASENLTRSFLWYLGRERRELCRRGSFGCVSAMSVNFFSRVLAGLKIWKPTPMSDATHTTTLQYIVGASLCSSEVCPSQETLLLCCTTAVLLCACCLCRGEISGGIVPAIIALMVGVQNGH